MTAFSEKRLGRVLLSEAFVTGDRSADVFKDFKILLAQPRYNEPGIIAYYGAHPDFLPCGVDPKDSPYYEPYWNFEVGFHFKIKSEVAYNNLSLIEWKKELNDLFRTELGFKLSDFDDYNWRDEYDSGVPADEAFDEWRAHTEDGSRSPANF